MAEIELNVAHRNTILAGTVAPFAAGRIAVRSGARAGADETAGGTLLAEVTPLPEPAFAAPAAGAVAKTGTWSTTVATTGAPGHYRLMNAAQTEIREGDAGDADDPGDPPESMLISDLVDGDLIEGGTLTIDTYVISQPAGDSVA